MIFMDYRSDIENSLSRAMKLREATGNDPRLSAEGRRDQVERLVSPLEAQAAQSAAAWLQRLEKDGARAEAAHLEARKRAADGVDRSKRESLRVDRLELVEYGAWADIRDKLQEDLELGDVDALAAWETLLPRMGKRHDIQSGPASDPATGYGAYYGRVKEAVADAVPEDVRTSREALTRVADAYMEARSFLENADYMRERYGAPGIFRDVLHPPPAVHHIQGDAGGAFVAEPSTRGAFG